MNLADLGTFLGLTVPFIAFQLYQHHIGDMEPWRKWPAALRALFYIALVYAILLLGAPETNAFIYFQF